MTTTLRILLVDDHRLFRDGMRALLATYPDLQIVAEASDAAQALEQAAAVDHDLIILDISLPGSNGMALLRDLKNRPQCRPVLVLTSHQHRDMVADAFAAGATGYALKHESYGDLVEAVRATAEGRRYLAPQLAPELLDITPASGGKASRGVLGVLSPREREIFDLIVRGETNAAMARRLGISVKTIETHRTRIMHKLDLHSVGELVRLAARHGLLAA
ncbi:MAG: two component transcriptional regulator, LuxR family [Myxococcales bacterium]|nr:two component transcriptional regulator, LuxR family [Myxococcales bacterium]